MQETRFDSWVRKIPWRTDRLPTPVFLGFPCGSAGKESAYNVGDLGLIPGLGRSPGEGKGYPLQYSGLENSMQSMGSQRLSNFQEDHQKKIIIPLLLCSFLIQNWWPFLIEHLLLYKNRFCMSMGILHTFPLFYWCWTRSVATVSSVP